MKVNHTHNPTRIGQNQYGTGRRPTGGSSAIEGVLFFFHAPVHAHARAQGRAHTHTQHTRTRTRTHTRACSLMRVHIYRDERFFFGGALSSFGHVQPNHVPRGLVEAVEQSFLGDLEGLERSSAPPEWVLGVLGVHIMPGTCPHPEKRDELFPWPSAALAQPSAMQNTWTLKMGEAKGGPFGDTKRG